MTVTIAGDGFLLAAGLVDVISSLAGPWASLYARSELLQFGLHATHLGGAAVAIVTALGADRMVLRMPRRAPAQRQAFLARLEPKHQRVVLALVVSVSTGVLLLLANVPRLLPSPVFWIKLTALAVLLWNGARLRNAGRALRAEPRHLPTAWAPLAAHAKRSVALWVAVVLLGLMLTVGI